VSIATIRPKGDRDVKTRKGCYDTTIVDGDSDDVPIRVYYEVHPFRRGSTDGAHGPKLEPDEPARIEISHVIYRQSITSFECPCGLTEEQEESVLLEIGNDLHERLMCASEERADARREERL
jgi:hypothetical protein